MNWKSESACSSAEKLSLYVTKKGRTIDVKACCSMDVSLAWGLDRRPLVVVVDDIVDSDVVLVGERMG